MNAPKKIFILFLISIIDILYNSAICRYDAEFERKENVGDIQNGDCSVFAYACFGRSNLFQAEACSQLFDQQTRHV